MNIGAGLRTQIETMFAPLNTVAAAHAFPHVAALSESLSERLDELSGSGPHQVTLPPSVASMFATAAIDIWLRGVHSFLISASLTDASPIWASVSGYYSSHYSVRAIAHLLGFFQLFGKKRIAQLGFERGQHTCSFDRKNAGDREHKLYWRVVKRNPLFSGDAIFAENADRDKSEVSHRDRANYTDHLGTCPPFEALSHGKVKDRVRHISKIEVSGLATPCRNSYPDIRTLQILAYHRLVKFRTLVDEAIGGGNRFWNAYRDPGWAKGLVDFQIAPPRGLDAIG